MPFAPHLLPVGRYEANHTCQNPDCDKCFFPTGNINEGTGELVTNGDWNIQLHHPNGRDYKTQYDYKLYNPDGSPRYLVVDTLCHAEDEVRATNLKNAMTLLMGQTIKTFGWIKKNDYQDIDVPLGTGQVLGLGRLELIDFNNKRRDAMQRVLLHHFGTVTVSSGVSVERAKELLGADKRRRI